MLESNGHAPVSTREEFVASVLIEGDDLLADLACANPRSPTTLNGFAAAMDKSGPRERIPMIMADVGGSGPVDQASFAWVVERLRDPLLPARQRDGRFTATRTCERAGRVG